MSAASDICSFISAQGLATFGTNLFPNLLPDAPADCVAVYDTPGQASLKAFGPTTAAEVHGFQVRVRNEVDGDAYDLAYSIFKLTENNGMPTVSGYLYWTALQPPFKLTTNENEREHYVFNGLAWREQL